jgi:hypothetical protein
MITRAWYDIHGRKYIDINNRQVKVPFRYGRVMSVDVQGHVPIQDMPTGAQVKAEIRTVKWDGLEYLVLKSICPMVPSPATESVSHATKTLNANSLFGL